MLWEQGAAADAARFAVRTGEHGIVFDMESKRQEQESFWLKSRALSLGLPMQK
jgi:hypothetical protein